jgi:hypothetical protein
VSTTDWSNEGEDAERVSSSEGEEDVPAGSAEELGGGEGLDSEADVGGGMGDLGGGGWTESGGQTESGAGVGDIGSEPGEASLGGGMSGEGSEDRL